jgi:hypothetical protein
MKRSRKKRSSLQNFFFPVMKKWVIKNETGMVEMAMTPKPVEGNKKTEGMLRPSIQ